MLTLPTQKKGGKKKEESFGYWKCKTWLISLSKQVPLEHKHNFVHVRFGERSKKREKLRE